MTTRVIVLYFPQTWCQFYTLLKSTSLPIQTAGVDGACSDAGLYMFNRRKPMI